MIFDKLECSAWVCDNTFKKNDCIAHDKQNKKLMRYFGTEKDLYIYEEKRKEEIREKELNDYLVSHGLLWKKNDGTYGKRQKIKKIT